MCKVNFNRTKPWTLHPGCKGFPNGLSWCLVWTARKHDHTTLSAECQICSCPSISAPWSTFTSTNENGAAVPPLSLSLPPMISRQTAYIFAPLPSTPLSQTYKFEQHILTTSYRVSSKSVTGKAADRSLHKAEFLHFQSKLFCSNSVYVSTLL